MKARKIIIGTAAAAFLLTGIVTPWRVTEKDGHGHIARTSVRFNWLWDAPSYPFSAYYKDTRKDVRIALDILAVEWLLVAGLAAAAWFVFAPSNRS